MRDPNRIDPFMDELGKIWKKNCPDWRFGQLMFNAQRVMQSHGTDIFYMEDDKLLEYFREWFDDKNNVCEYCAKYNGDGIEDTDGFDYYSCELMNDKHLKEYGQYSSFDNQVDPDECTGYLCEKCLFKKGEKYIKQFGTIEEWSKERNRKIF